MSIDFSSEVNRRQIRKDLQLSNWLSGVTASAGANSLESVSVDADDIGTLVEIVNAGTTVLQTWHLRESTTPADPEVVVVANSADGTNLRWHNVTGAGGGGTPVTNATVNAAIETDPAASRSAMEISGSQGALLTGSGVPDVGLGGNGDTYLDSASGVVYAKSGDAWAVVYTPTNAITHAVNALPADGFGSNGDLALIYSGGAVTALAEKSGGTWTQIATIQPAPASVDLLAEFKIAETWAGGGNITATSGLVGTNNLQFVQLVGTAGYSRPDHLTTPGTRPFIYAQSLKTGAVSGDAVAVSPATNLSGNGVTRITTFTEKLNDFVFSSYFKFNTAGDAHIGWGTQPAIGGAAEPIRFIGMKALSGQTFFQFDMHNGTPAPVNSSIPIDDGWHRFDMRWTGTQWSFSIDGETPILITNTLNTSFTGNFHWRVKTNSAVNEYLFLGPSLLYGVMTNI